MYPPPDAIQALKRLHSQARLAWFGLDGPELNKGEFALLQLYPKKDAETSLYTRWEDRGPVFGDKYDKDTHVPLWLANFTKEEIFSGSFIAKVRRWMTPIQARVYDSALERGREDERAMQELAREAGEYIWWRKNNVETGRPPIIPQKFLSEKDKKILSGAAAAEKDLTESHLPPIPASEIARAKAY